MKKRVLQEAFRADVLSAPLLIFPIHAPILRFGHVCQRLLSQLCRTISCGCPRRNIQLTRACILNGSSPLMPTSSELAKSSMDLRMNASYVFVVERVAKFMNDDSCAVASISLWNVVKRLSLPWEQVMSHVPSPSVAPPPRFVKLSPRNTTRKIRRQPA